MKTFSIVFTALACAIMAPTTFAQDTADDQADVWATIERQWNANEKGGSRWIDEMLNDSFSGWPMNSPAPRNKASVKMWQRFNSELGSGVAHELYPLAIVVDGDVAVAHYLYTNAVRDKDGEVEVRNGRYTDVLVRSDDGWKFLAWHGGDDPDSGQ